MYTRKLPSAALIAHLWEYDPDTGDMWWRNPHHHNCSIGPVDPGGGAHGYRVVTFYQNVWLQHRLIWKLMTGSDPDPDKMIDHTNEDPGDNRWCNLRQISRSMNVYRSSKFRRPFHRVVQRNSSGRWQVRAERRRTVEGRVQQEKYHVGTFDTEAEARAADISQRGAPRPKPDNTPKVRRTASGRWEARVWVGPGRRVHLGTFDTEEQARNARATEKIRT